MAESLIATPPGLSMHCLCTKCVRGKLPPSVGPARDSLCKCLWSGMKTHTISPGVSQSLISQVALEGLQSSQKHFWSLNGSEIIFSHQVDSYCMPSAIGILKVYCLKCISIRANVPVTNATVSITYQKNCSNSTFCGLSSFTVATAQSNLIDLPNYRKITHHFFNPLPYILEHFFISFRRASEFITTFYKILKEQDFAQLFASFTYSLYRYISPCFHFSKMTLIFSVISSEVHCMTLLPSGSM